MRAPARDTIAAISSALPGGPASSGSRAVLGRAILRLSGPRALALAESVFHGPASPTSARLSFVRRWRRISGFVTWRAHSLPACAYVMRAPHTYTREDIVELHALALPWLLSSLLERLFEAGARPALPGEFTRRALENGRVTLEQAEVIGALIASRSAGEARVHAARLTTHAHTWRADLRREVEELLALVEFGLDFSHDDAGVLPPAEMLARLEHLRSRMEEFCGPAGGGPECLPYAHATDQSAVLSSGLPRILLLGPTNAGKSSLFNRLLGRAAAIVSPHPHTTRDTVEAALPVPGAGTALLIDSAGWGPLSPLPLREGGEGREGGELLRQAAWNATLLAVRSADVIVLMLDRSVPLPAQHGFELAACAVAQAKPAALAVVWSKADLPPAPDWAADAIPHAVLADLGLSRFEISSVTGCGISALHEFLVARAAELAGQTRDAHLAVAASASAAARTAASALSRATQALAAGQGEDIVAVELREALHAFALAEGVLLRHDALTEATLDRIFSRFCVGK